MPPWRIFEMASRRKLSGPAVLCAALLWSLCAAAQMPGATGERVPAGRLSDTTGTGSVVRQTSPTLVTPNIGAASGTSLALGGALPAAVANTLILAGVSSNPTFGADGEGAAYLIVNNGLTLGG